MSVTLTVTVTLIPFTDTWIIKPCLGTKANIWYEVDNRHIKKNKTMSIKIFWKT